MVAIIAAGLAGALMYFGSGGFDDTPATAVSANGCDSCSARKKDLTRLRDALGTAANEGQ
ncbi:hypothetical protein [Roseovarius sp.]|uniref:hypothetical protein n=1 Tax=Roseovarius sp. TaxID=1486281 RepID=UPI003D11BDE4